jgi:predicted nucleic acid-binding protein
VLDPQALAVGALRHALDRAQRDADANDVLIALSARSIGASVVAQNERDYRAIMALRPFRLVLARS